MDKAFETSIAACVAKAVKDEIKGNVAIVADIFKKHQVS